MGVLTEQLRPWLVLGCVDSELACVTIIRMVSSLKPLFGPVLAVYVLIGVPSSGAAADFSDPTWPCIQRKVENLSVGLMWPHPVKPAALDPETLVALDALVDRLVLRRVPIEELESLVTEFIVEHGRDAALIGQVFSETFDRLSRTRTKLIKGIGEYSLKQIALSERIDANRARMDDLMAADAPDFDQVDSLEEQLDWDERIYTDRARSLTYVCESPVLIEKRLYAIAQMLLAQIAD